jgi:hypothetical protein
VKFRCKLRTALHHHHGKLGMTEEGSNVQRSVWCAKDIEPSNCFFFETKSQCVAKWGFQDSYLSYSTHMKKFSKIISGHNILVMQPAYWVNLVELDLFFNWYFFHYSILGLLRIRLRDLFICFLSSYPNLVIHISNVFTG